MWKKLKSAFNASKPPELTTLFSAQLQDPYTDYQKALLTPPVCYSEEFRDVPKPTASTMPELIAARWAAGDLRPEQTPGIAADMLESGLDTPSMRRLAGEMRVGCRADVEELVIKMLRELGAEVPDSEVEAKMLSTKQISREVIAGMRNPWKAAHELKIIWQYEIWHHKHLCDVAQVIDEVQWDPSHGRTFSALNKELIQTFALLGARTASGKRMLSLGCLEGKGWIADDFDAPLPDDLLALFEGRNDPPLSQESISENPSQPLPCVRMQIAGYFFGRAFSHNVSAAFAAFGAEIDDPVRALDHVEVVFDYDQRAAAVD
jgi:hypothetical protein